MLDPFSLTAIANGPAAFVAKANVLDVAAMHEAAIPVLDGLHDPVMQKEAGVTKETLSSAATPSTLTTSPAQARLTFGAASSTSQATRPVRFPGGSPRGPSYDL